MILLWFIIGIGIIFGIARYNESNKLFWQLLIAFILGFSVTKMIQQASETQSNETLVQVYPTQVSNAYTWAMISHSLMAKETLLVTAHPSVSQEYTPVLHESNITLKKICGKVRDQPQETLTNPPELCLPKDISILHDYG